MTVTGVRVGMAYAAANSSWEVHLYNAAGDELASCVVDDEDRALTATSGETELGFAATNLLPDVNYRVTVEATHASAVVALGGFDFESVASKVGYPEGARWQKTSRTDGGAWTEDESAVPHIALRVSAITVPSGSSGPRWL
jgi:hypothetical protein